MATWLPSKNDGSGKPNIICPMEKYISITRKTTDEISLFLSFGVSVSSNAFSSSDILCFFAPLGEAP